MLYVGYKGDLKRKEAEGYDISCNYELSETREPSGVLKRLYMARNLYDEKAILSYGDTYKDIELLKLKNLHVKSSNEATIIVYIQNLFGLFGFDRNGKVTYFKEKPVLNYEIRYVVINKSAIVLAPRSVIDMHDGDGLVTFSGYGKARIILSCGYTD